MPSHPPASTELAKIVERQMRNWELARAQRPAAPPASTPPAVQEFVAISRTVGAGGSQIGTLLGQRLGWPVFDREILLVMAGDDRVRDKLYRHLDERDVGWLESTLRWVVHGEFRKDDYFHRLSETVLALARQSPSIFLGRAADLILPADRGVRVRVNAALERRAATYALRTNIPAGMARAEIERIDRERAAFRQSHFGRAVDENALFDLVIHTDRVTPETAVNVILAALQPRLAVSPPPDHV